MSDESQYKFNGYVLTTLIICFIFAVIALGISIYLIVEKFTNSCPIICPNPPPNDTRGSGLNLGLEEITEETIEETQRPYIEETQRPYREIPSFITFEDNNLVINGRPYREIPSFITFEDNKMIINGTIEVKNDISSVVIGPDELKKVDIMFSQNN